MALVAAPVQAGVQLSQEPSLDWHQKIAEPASQRKGSEIILEPATPTKSSITPLVFPALKEPVVGKPSPRNQPPQQPPQHEAATQQQPLQAATNPPLLTLLPPLPAQQQQPHQQPSQQPSPPPPPQQQQQQRQQQQIPGRGKGRGGRGGRQPPGGVSAPGGQAQTSHLDSGQAAAAGGASSAAATPTQRKPSNWQWWWEKDPADDKLPFPRQLGRVGGKGAHLVYDLQLQATCVGDPRAALDADPDARIFCYTDPGDRQKGSSLLTLTELLDKRRLLADKKKGLYRDGAFKEGAHRETEKDRAKTKNDACRREAWSNLLTLYHATLSQQYGAIPEELLGTFRVDALGNVVSNQAAVGSIAAFSVDHIFPWSRGGLTERNNLMAMSELANSDKSNELWLFLVASIQPEATQPVPGAGVRHVSGAAGDSDALGIDLEATLGSHSLQPASAALPAPAPAPQHTQGPRVLGHYLLKGPTQKNKFKPSVQPMRKGLRASQLCELWSHLQQVLSHSPELDPTLQPSTGAAPPPPPPPSAAAAAAAAAAMPLQVLVTLLCFPWPRLAERKGQTLSVNDLVINEPHQGEVVPAQPGPSDEPPASELPTLGVWRLSKEFVSIAQKLALAVPWLRDLAGAWVAPGPEEPGLLADGADTQLPGTPGAGETEVEGDEEEEEQEGDGSSGEGVQEEATEQEQTAQDPTGTADLFAGGDGVVVAHIGPPNARTVGTLHEVEGLLASGPDGLLQRLWHLHDGLEERQLLPTPADLKRARKGLLYNQVPPADHSITPPPQTTFMAGAGCDAEPAAPSTPVAAGTEQDHSQPAALAADAQAIEQPAAAAITATCSHQPVSDPPPVTVLVLEQALQALHLFQQQQEQHTKAQQLAALQAELAAQGKGLDGQGPVGGAEAAAARRQRLLAEFVYKPSHINIKAGLVGGRDWSAPVGPTVSPARPSARKPRHTAEVADPETDQANRKEAGIAADAQAQAAPPQGPVQIPILGSGEDEDEFLQEPPSLGWRLVSFFTCGACLPRQHRSRVVPLPAGAGYDGVPAQLQYWQGGEGKRTAMQLVRVPAAAPIPGQPRQDVGRQQQGQVHTPRQQGQPGPHQEHEAPQLPGAVPQHEDSPSQVADAEHKATADAPAVQPQEAAVAAAPGQPKGQDSAGMALQRAQQEAVQYIQQRQGKAGLIGAAGEEDVPRPPPLYLPPASRRGTRDLPQPHPVMGKLLPPLPGVSPLDMWRHQLALEQVLWQVQGGEAPTKRKGRRPGWDAAAEAVA